MTTDVDEVERRRSARKIKEKYSLDELKDVLSTYSGRAVIYEILTECDIDAPIVNDKYQTFRELGKRDVGLWLRLKILTVDIDSVIIMENESRKRAENLNF